MACRPTCPSAAQLRPDPGAARTACGSNDAQTGHHDMDIPVPLDAVSRVEVLHGSGSTMYGSDAVGGVVNIITEPPEGHRIAPADGRGQLRHQPAAAFAAGSFGELSEQITFARDFSTGFMPDRDYRNLQLASSTHSLTAWGASDLTLAYMDHPFGADQFYGPYPSWEDTKTWFAGWRQALGKKTEVSFAYRRHSDLFVLFRDEPEIYTNHHADESYQARAAPHARASRQHANFTTAWKACTNPSSATTWAIHARSRAAPRMPRSISARCKRFSLSLSAREEVYRNFSARVQPHRGRRRTGSRRSLKFRASASRAFRVPSYTELYYSDPPISAIPICARSAPGPTKAASIGTPARACAAI